MRLEEITVQGVCEKKASKRPITKSEAKCQADESEIFVVFIVRRNQLQQDEVANRLDWAILFSVFE